MFLAVHSQQLRIIPHNVLHHAIAKSYKEPHETTRESLAAT